MIQDQINPNKLKHESSGYTKSLLKKKGIVSPIVKEWFNVNSKTKIGVPVNLSGQDLEEWKQRMIAKYANIMKFSIKKDK